METLEIYEKIAVETIDTSSNTNLGGLVRGELLVFSASNNTRRTYMSDINVNKTPYECGKALGSN